MNSLRPLTDDEDDITKVERVLLTWRRATSVHWCALRHEENGHDGARKKNLNQLINRSR